MFNFHTYSIDSVPCLLNCRPDDALLSDPEQVRVADGVFLSVGLHPWEVVFEDWQTQVAAVRAAAMKDTVWAIGECGLDKVRGAALSVQMEAFRAQIAVAEEVEKPMVVHCVRAFDELLMLRRELDAVCQQQGKSPQPWVIHGFRGKPEQAKQLLAKGLLLSFCQQYNVETLRVVFASTRPFFLETDDRPLSVRQIYVQAARHLGVDIGLLDCLCDPRQTVFCQRQMASFRH